MKQRSLSSFFGEEYLEYAKYVLENRAIPSVIDGLKPGARKILHAALSSLKYDSSSKMLNLVGLTYSKSHYHHGDASLESTIINLGSRYSDTFAPLGISGTGGSLRSHASAAPRYLSVYLSKYAKIYEQDSEILDYNYDDSERIEPKYYLPLIPLILLKRDMGIALGYAFKNTTSFNPIDVIDACSAAVEGKPIQKLTPHVEEYDGYWELSTDGRILSKAHCEYLKDKIIVKSLPVSQTFSSFEKNLAKCLERNTIVKWENNSKEDTICYVIHVNASKLASIMERGIHHRIFKTAEYLPKSTLYMLDENKRIINFKDEIELIQYFTKFRLAKYDELRTKKLSAFNEKLEYKLMVQKFIDLYLSGKIVINKDVTQDELEKVLKKHKINNDVLSIPLRNLTKTQYEKLQSEIDELQKLIDYYTKTPTKTLYINDLQSLRKQFENDFPRQEFVIAK